MMSSRKLSESSTSSLSTDNGESTGPQVGDESDIGNRGSGKVTWHGEIGNKRELATDDRIAPTRSRAGVDVGTAVGGALGGFSRNTLAPLTPLEKRGNEIETQYKKNRKPQVGFAYSSPNLKSLNQQVDIDRSKFMDYYLSGIDHRGQNGNYVDPLYRHLNPSMGGMKNRPVWSLNQPLPHVLDQSLAARMIQKNMEVKSRASSKSGSRNVSRSGSMTSVNDWKKVLRRVGSNKRLDDIEAQILSENKTRDGGDRRALRDPKSLGEGNVRHNAHFALGDESYPASLTNEASTSIKIPGESNVREHKAALLKEDFEEEGDSTEVSDGIGGGCIDHTDSEELVFTNYWAKIRYHMREPFAEFLGTLVLVIFGVGGNLQATVTNGSGGSYESLSFAWGFGCMLGVYVAGGVSGGHINPAVTISMAIFRKFPWKKVPVYILAQIIGAFFGGAMAYGYFWSSITEFEGGPTIRTAASGACLFTNPKSYVTWRNAFFDEFIGAAILVGCLMALLDDSNAPPANGMTAFIVGLLVAGIGMALGYQTSFTINPARDLGPRIFSAMVGYGRHPFHLTHWWWTWGAWGGPIAGGISGALVYDIFIFTGCESPINYPDNGYIEDRVKKLFHSNPHIVSDSNKNGNSERMKKDNEDKT